MKKLLTGMVLLSSFALAEPMPKGTPQDDAAQQIISAVNGFQFDCPDSVLSNAELEPEYTYQVACGASDLDSDLMRSTLELQLDYEPVNAWQYLEDADNFIFRRLYALDPGAFYINLSDSEDGGLIVVSYSEPR